MQHEPGENHREVVCIASASSAILAATMGLRSSSMRIGQRVPRSILDHRDAGLRLLRLNDASAPGLRPTLQP